MQISDLDLNSFVIKNLIGNNALDWFFQINLHFFLDYIIKLIEPELGILLNEIYRTGYLFNQKCKKNGVKTILIPHGYAGGFIYGPLNMDYAFLSGKMAQFTMLSMSEAVAKQIAENMNTSRERELICSSLKSYIILVFSFMLLSVTLSIIFSKQLTLYVLGDQKYLSYFYLGLFSFPILILDSIPFAVLKGLNKIIANIKINTACKYFALILSFCI